MTIKEALKKYHKIEIELLLMHVLKKSKEFIFLHPEFKLKKVYYTGVIDLARRRTRGEPIAYVLGYKDFYGLRFRVNRNVLIPRPETEIIVDNVIASASEAIYLKDRRVGKTKPLPPRDDKTIKILDVGTGSGCVAIAVAKKVTGYWLQVTASDISLAALKVAKQNAKKHGVKVNFIKSDLLKNIKGDFDIIIANLPYGWYGVKNRFSSVKDGLKYEPQMALYTKEKGLFQIRRLLEQIGSRKYKPKMVFLEFDPRQKSELQKLIKKTLPSSQTKFYRDLNNLWRCAEINLHSTRP